jgi:hypothetical protein
MLNNFTIGDYGQGEKPLFDGNKIKPILITDSKNVTVSETSISVDRSGKLTIHHPISSF